MAKKEMKGLSIAGMVCGIVGIVFAWVPGVNVIGIILGAVAAVFGAVCIAKKQNSGQAIAGLVLGIITVVIAIVMNATTVKVAETFVEASKDTSSDISKMAGNSTNEILGKDVEVNIGEFTVIKEEYLTKTKLPVTVKNLTNETKSFNVHIEAVDENGNRIDDGFAYASNLAAGQSQPQELFTLVTSDKIDAMKAAKYNIVQIQEF